MVLIEFHRLNGAVNFFLSRCFCLSEMSFDRVSFLPDFSRFVKFTTRFLELQVQRAFFILIGCFLNTQIPISMKTGPYYHYYALLCFGVKDVIIRLASDNNPRNVIVLND